MTCAGRQSILLLGACLGLFLCVAAVADEQAQIDFANGLFSRGFNEEAAEEYRAYLDQYPQGTHRDSAQYRLGEAAMATADFAGALKAFDIFLTDAASSPLRPRVTLRKAVALYRLKRHAEARTLLDSLTGESSDEGLLAEAFYHLGKLHFETGQHGDAVRAFKSLSQRGGGSPLVAYGRYQLAFVYLAQRDLENAAVLFSEVAGDVSTDAELRMECRFRAAETYDKIGWFEAAVKAYEQLRTEHPGSDYARRASYGYFWALYHAGMYSEALVGAREFLSEFPKSPHQPGVLYLQGNCLQQQQKLEEAIALYRRIGAEFPGSDFAKRAQYKAAWALFLNGQAAESRVEIVAFLKSESKMALVGDAAFLLGTIESSEGNHQDAYEEFRLVAQKYPQSEFAAEALYKSAESLALLGEHARAGEVFEQYAEKYADGPLATQAILRAGDANFAAGAYGQAVDQYRRILSGSPSKGEEEQAVYRLAVAYHNAKDREASVKTFLGLLETFPESGYAQEAQLRVGEYALQIRKEPIEALHHFEAALECAPTGKYAGRALKGLATARIETKDLDGAAETFMRVITEHPELVLKPEVYAWVGQHQFDRELWDPASLAFEALIRHTPGYPKVDRVLFKIAEASERSGEVEPALARYESVVRAAPHGAMAVEAKFRMAKINEGLNRIDEAIRLYDEAASTDSGNTAAMARFHLGEVYEKQGKFPEAARNYMRVAILYFHETLSPESLWRAARCFELNENTERALRTYQEVLDEFPDSEQAVKAKAKLESLGAS